jgi:hypothetical protein
MLQKYPHSPGALRWLTDEEHALDPMDLFESASPALGYSGEARSEIDAILFLAIKICDCLFPGIDSYYKKNFNLIANLSPIQLQTETLLKWLRDLYQELRGMVKSESPEYYFIFLISFRKSLEISNLTKEGLTDIIARPQQRSIDTQRLAKYIAPIRYRPQQNFNSKKDLANYFADSFLLSSAVLRGSAEVKAGGMAKATHGVICNHKIDFTDGFCLRSRGKINKFTCPYVARVAENTDGSWTFYEPVYSPDLEPLSHASGRFNAVVDAHGRVTIGNVFVSSCGHVHSLGGAGITRGKYPRQLTAELEKFHASGRTEAEIIGALKKDRRFVDFIDIVSKAFRDFVRKHQSNHFQPPE